MKLKSVITLRNSLLKIIGTLTIVSLSLSTLAQISGPTTVSFGQTATYSSYDDDPNATYFWTAVKGSAGSNYNTGPQGYTHNVSVTWTQSGTGSISLYATTATGTYEIASAQVNIGGCTVPPVPVPNFVLNTSCAPATVSYTNSPPPGVTWYWVSGPSGQETGNSTNTSDAFYNSSYVYVRAVSSCWSTGAGTYFATLNATPAIPATPTVSTNSCGSKTLTRGTPPGGITWYWQTSYTGTSTADANPTYTVNAPGGTYYLRARNNTTGCWSLTSTTGVPVFPYETPAPTSTPVTTTNTCGNQYLTVSGSPPAEITWYWQGTNAAGTSTAQPYTTPYTVTTGTNVVYHLRAYNYIRACWSNGTTSVASSVLIPPDTPTGAITISAPFCGPKSVSFSNSPPTGQVWYWQGTNPNGTSTSGTTFFSAYVTGTYYLRAFHIAKNCWSISSQSIFVTVNDPATPALTTTIYQCGNQTLSKVGGPQAGESWYWQGTNANGVDETSPTATAANYTVTTPGTATYYLRARNTLGCWSTASISSSVTFIPPPAPPYPTSTGNTCGSKTLTKPTAPNGITYYWQGTNASGEDASSAIATSSTFEAANSINYYLRAKDNNGNCWSTTSFMVTVDPVDLVLSNYNTTNAIGQATNSITLKPGFYTAGGVFTAKVVISPECNDLINWNEQLVYNESGTLISDTRSYYDGFGNQLESMTKDFVSNKIFATQSLFNSYGQAVAGSLPAPIQEPSFLYKKIVVTNPEDLPYSANDFDLRTTINTAGEVNNPRPVGTKPGTAGWYYSSNNTLEPLTPITQYPYTRSYTKEGPEPTSNVSAGPGDQHRMGSTHEVKSDRYVIGTTDLTHYYALRSYFSTSTTTANKGYKHISTDPNGKRSASFVDADGRAIASAVITGGTAPNFTYDYWSYTYYNDAGQVVATVAPNGVNTASTVLPSFVTYYKYDHLGRLIETTSPDEGTAQFVYSLDGKIRFSQSQEQRNATPKRFSYTNYDYQGRLIESGEYTQGTYVFEPHSTLTPAGNSVLNTTILENYGFSGTANNLETAACTDVTKIYYDKAQDGNTQTFLYGQVSKTENANAKTWYSYDEAGQLIWMKQDITGLGVKTIDYSYDYFGNVLEVAYQKTQPDAFYHHYTYDINNRLVDVKTSKDGVTKTQQAKYYYYLHGPLKRVELANNLQGLDYVYTINGALKSINHSDVTKDPGGDAGPAHANFSADIFGEMLNYYDNDYTGAGYSAGTVTTTGLTNNYNGVIKAASWFTPVDNTAGKKVYGYTYDNLYQFQNAQFGTLAGTAGSYAATFSPTEAYREGVPGYDKNGNIQSMIRKGKTGNTLGNYGYSYQASTNKLTSITNGGAAMMNYTYNANGQLKQQVEGANTMNVTYTAYGLVKDVRNGTNQLMVQYSYDDKGNRVRKDSYNAGVLSKTTFYVHDASGTVLATYEQPNPGTLALVEVPIYGAGRLGMLKPAPDRYFYELNDHLGNVRAVIGAPATDTYTATMETETAAAEDLKFKNISPRSIFVAANNTPGGNEVIRLNNARPMGAGISLKVSPGDVITIETYAYYEGGSGYSATLPLATIIPAIAGAFGGVSGALGDPGKVYNAFNTDLSGGFAGAAGSGNDAVPAAYLNMIMFDNNILADPLVLPMSAIPVTSAANFAKQKLTIGPITIPSPGYVYIYVNNNSNTPNFVNFDDLKVTHLHSAYVAGSDFYPFGLTMSDRDITQEPYRYGYQGQYSEEDTETGWNSFELRQYDARFGRWLGVDPYGQFASPYVGMGNNPVSGTDPDGGWSWIAAGTGFALGSGAALLTGHKDDWWKWGLASGVAAGVSSNQTRSSGSGNAQTGYHEFGGLKLEFNSKLYSNVGNFFLRPGLSQSLLISYADAYIETLRSSAKENNRYVMSLGLDVNDDNDPRRVLVLPKEGYRYKGARKTGQFKSYSSYTEQIDPIDLVPNRIRQGRYQIKIHNKWFSTDAIVSGASVDWLDYTTPIWLRALSYQTGVKSLIRVSKRAILEFHKPFY